jgi:hypothetical protein
MRVKIVRLEIAVRHSRCRSFISKFCCELFCGALASSTLADESHRVDLGAVHGWHGSRRWTSALVGHGLLNRGP